MTFFVGVSRAAERLVFTQCDERGAPAPLGGIYQDLQDAGVSLVRVGQPVRVPVPTTRIPDFDGSTLAARHSGRSAAPRAVIGLCLLDSCPGVLRDHRGQHERGLLSGARRRQAVPTAKFRRVLRRLLSDDR